MFAFNIWKCFKNRHSVRTATKSSQPSFQLRIHLRFINWLINKFEISYTIFVSINVNCCSMQLHTMSVVQEAFLIKISIGKFSPTNILIQYVLKTRMECYNSTEFFDKCFICHHRNNKHNYIWNYLISKHLLSWIFQHASMCKKISTQLMMSKLSP